MAGFIYDALISLYSGNSMPLNIKTTELFNLLLAIFADGGPAPILMASISSIAGGLLIIFFLADLLEKQDRDALTTERLLQSFVKLIIAVFIVVNTLTILRSAILMGEWAATSIENTDIGTVDTSGIVDGNDKAVYTINEEKEKNNREVFVETDGLFGGVTKSLEALGPTLMIFIPYIISLIVDILLAFFLISNFITIIVRGVFAPIALCQLFEDGSKSNGIKYLKSFISETLVIAVIYVAIKAGDLCNAFFCTDISPLMVDGTLDFEMVVMNLTAGMCWVPLIGKAAVVGVCGSATTIAKAVVGSQ